MSGRRKRSEASGRGRPGGEEEGDEGAFGVWLVFFGVSDYCAGPGTHWLVLIVSASPTLRCLLRRNESSLTLLTNITGKQYHNIV